MAKALKTIGMIAGAVALVATGIGAVAGGALAATAASVSTWAGLAAGVANLGANLLYKPPPARGSITQVVITPDPPQPYVMGEGLVGGIERHRAGYGATLKKVPNPYLGIVHVYSGGGPIEQITPYVDQAAVTAWYSGYLYTDTQLGACPESTALTPQFAGFTGWDSTSKLSGQAAILWNLKFDKDGKRFASGVPQLGAYGKWVKAYDPRLDSTRSGGSGAQRITDESTWTWTENPALHAATYAYGRHQNGKRVLGVGLPDAAIDWAVVSAWANVCDANGWTIFGAVYEPGDRWQNLQEIAAAGAGAPIISGGVLSFHYSAPRVALDTFTDDDLVEADFSVTAMTSWRERLNTIVPKYRSPSHNWEMVAAEAVSVSGYVAEDGEVKQVEWPFNLVKDADQATQLARYKLEDSRERQPIEVTYGPRVRAYRPGDCVNLDHPELGLDGPAVILKRRFDPATMTVTLTFIGETAGKHAWALGETGTPPAAPAIGMSGEDRDNLSYSALQPFGWQSVIIRQAAAKNPRDSGDAPRAMLTATDAGATATVSVARHDWDYPGGTADVTRETGEITGLDFATTYYVYFDDDTLEDGTPTYAATTDPAAAQNSTDYPDRHPLGSIITPADGAADTTGGDNVGYGFDFTFYY